MEIYKKDDERIQVAVSSTQKGKKKQTKSFTVLGASLDDVFDVVIKAIEKSK